MADQKEEVPCPIYDLELKEFHFKVRSKTRKDKEGKPVLEDMVLREMAGPTRDLWVEFMDGRARETKDGKRTGYLKDYKGVQAKFLSMCLFDADNRPVKEDEIATWPSSMQDDLFTRGQKMNALHREAEEEAKNG